MLQQCNSASQKVVNKPECSSQTNDSNRSSLHRHLAELQEGLNIPKKEQRGHFAGGTGGRVAEIEKPGQQSRDFSKTDW